MKILSSLVALVLLGHSSPSVAADVTARVNVAPARALLGVPIEITLVVTNSSTDPYVWPPHVAARVVDASGEAQIVVDPRGDWSGKIDAVTVPAGATATVVLDAPTFLDGNRFVPDSTTLGPGSYRLELFFGRNEFRVPTGARFDPRLEPLGAEHRVAAQFELVEPTGDDATVYRRLRSAITAGVPLSAVYGDTPGNPHDWVWREYPASAYAPFLREPTRSDAPNLIELSERVLSRLESQPAIRDEVGLELLERLSRHAGNTYHDHGLKAALKVADAVERLITKLDASQFATTRARLSERRADFVDRRRLLSEE